MNTKNINHPPVTERIGLLPWESIYADLQDRGFATTGQILAPDECDRLINMYADRTLFRSQVIMQNRGYGRGEYQYFDYPLPETIDLLRHELYARLVTIANHWHTSLQREIFPDSLAKFSELCRKAGQTKPTPLLLKYQSEDYNCSIEICMAN